MRITIDQPSVSLSTGAGKVYTQAGERAVESRIPRKNFASNAAKMASDTVLNISKRFEDAYNFKTNLKSKTDLTTQAASMSEELASDPKYMDVSADEYTAEYTRRYKKISDSISGNLQTTGSKKYFNSLSSEKLVNGEINARALGRKRVADSTLTTGMESMDVSQQSYMLTGNVEDLQEINDTLTGLVEAGVMSKSSAATELKARNENSIIGNMEQRIDQDPTQALKDLTDNKEFYVGKDGEDYLVSADKYNRLVAKAKAEKEKANIADTAELNSKIKDSLTSMTLTGQPVPGMKQEIINTYGEKKSKSKVKEYERNLKAAQLKYDFGEEIKNASGKDLAGVVSKWDPRKSAGKTGISSKSEAYNYGLQMLTQRNQMLNTDSVKYVMDNSPSMNTPEKILAEQRRLGVVDSKLSILPNNQASQISRSIMSVKSTDEAVNAINGLQDQYGKNFPTVWKDLVNNGLSSSMQLIGNLTSVEDVQTRENLFNGIKTGSKELLSSLGENSKEVKTDVNSALTGVMEEFQNSIISGGNSPERISQYNDMFEALTLASYQYVLQGKDAGDAAEKAFEDTIGNKYHFIESENDHFYRVPSRYDDGMVEDYLEESLYGLDVKNIIVPGTAGDTPRDMVNKEYKKSLVNDGYWSTNEDESGVVLFDAFQEPVMNQDGVRYEIKFEDMTYGDPASKTAKGDWVDF